MKKRFVYGAIAVFLTIELLNILVHAVILSSAYQATTSVWRTDYSAKVWIAIVNTLVTALFFTFFFLKGYEGKGVAEGVRFGFYVGFWLNMFTAFGTYMMIAIPASLAMQWFAFGMVEYILAGIFLALIVGALEKRAKKADPAR